MRRRWLRWLCATCLGATACAAMASTASADAAWTALCPTTSPPGRYNSTIAYDPNSSRVIMFGGAPFGALADGLADTWAWTGSTWERLRTNSSPPARAAASMAYDPVSRSLILFGGGLFTPAAPGSPSYLTFNDTWAFDGSTWRQLKPATSPPARSHATLALDPNSQRLILFAGRRATQTTLSDTWVWSGSDWLNASPRHHPPALDSASVASDPATGQLILFGGYTSDYINSQATWAWSNGDWAQLSPAASPPGRFGASMGYSSVNHRVLVAGGSYWPTPTSNTGATLSDVWAWDGSSWSPLPGTLIADSPYLVDDPATGQFLAYEGGRQLWAYGSGQPAGSCSCGVAAPHGDQSTFGSSLETPACAVGSASSLLTNGLVVAGMVLLATFPAQLFNHTFEENHDTISQWWRRRGDGVRRRPPFGARLSPTGRRRSAFVAVVAGGALLGTLLDPGAGLNLRSLALVLAIAAALCIACLVTVLSGTAFRRLRHIPGGLRLRPLPSGLVVAAICVLISRLTDFHPGYLYGVIAGVSFAGVLSTRDEGQSVAAWSIGTLVVSAVAWFVWVPAHSLASSSGAFLPSLLEDLLAAVFVGGLVGLVLGLVPLRFLPGHRLAGWHWAAWVVTFGIASLAFTQVVLRPESGPAHVNSPPFWTTAALFILFGLLSVAFWGYFRLHPAPARETILPG